MSFESISFNLSSNFFTNLKKNAINTTNIKVSFFNRKKTSFMTFVDFDALKLYQSQNYLFCDCCETGELVSIESFYADSSLYGFTSNFIVTDVNQNYHIIKGYDSNQDLNVQRDIFVTRQYDIIEDLILQYRNYYQELSKIYITGIYSPCYAEPGWSEGTGYLENLGSLAEKNKAFT